MGKGEVSSKEICMLLNNDPAILHLCMIFLIKMIYKMKN